MEREYFCCGCGLFHWLDINVERVEPQGCPNKECERQSPFQSDIPVFAVDTVGYFYFAENHKDFIDKVKWSSVKYAPKEAIAVYKKQGIPIKD